jgi:hypothetical protein
MSNYLPIDYPQPDENGEIDIPDELMPLFNKLGNQMCFHKISGKNEVLTIAHMVFISREFFEKHPELLRK